MHQYSLMDDRDSWEDKIPLIESQIGYRFRKRSLLKSAFTHRSLLNEELFDCDCNQRLEFLGDALLGAIVAHHLFDAYRSSDEGILTKRRAKIIDRSSCAEYAQVMNVGQYLMLGKGISVASNSSLLADLFEAITGAIFLDSDYPQTYRFVIAQCHRKLSAAFQADEQGDYKSRLQQRAHQLLGALPEYVELAAEGPQHRPLFTIAVSLKGKFLGSGSGSSKKRAEQRAARQALTALDGEDKGAKHQR